MTAADTLLECLNNRGFGPFVGVPCSLLGRLIMQLSAGGGANYLPVNNEGEAVAIAAGACLANRKPVVLMQNSGLGNAVNPITSLVIPHRLPLLFIISWRGQPGLNDEPQHQLMGSITPKLLELLAIKYEVIDGSDFDFEGSMERVATHQHRDGSYALVATAESFR